MNKNSNNWLIPAIVGAFLMIFLVLAGTSYSNDLKRQIAKAEDQADKLQQQLTEKTQEVNKKNESINDLTRQNSGLTTDIEEKRKELEGKSKEIDQKLAQINKLQGSLKTVGRCLLGTMGVIEAFKRNDGELARNSALLMEATCQESGRIVGEVERFSTK